MARIVTFTIITIGLLMLINMAGLPTATGGFLDAISAGDLNLIWASIFYTKVKWILAAAVVGIVAGFFTKQSTETFIVGGFAGFLLTWTITDFVYVYSYFNSTLCPAGSSCTWLANIAALVIVPLLIGYFISIIQWWRGNDI